MLYFTKASGQDTLQDNEPSKLFVSNNVFPNFNLQCSKLSWVLSIKTVIS